MVGPIVILDVGSSACKADSQWRARDDHSVFLFPCESLIIDKCIIELVPHIILILIYKSNVYFTVCSSFWTKAGQLPLFSMINPIAQITLTIEKLFLFRIAT